MRALVVGFITIDTIKLPMRTVTSIGGPPCYAGLICARFGLDVSALTKVGGDFPADQTVWLSRNGITLRPTDTSPSQKTTRFEIEVNSSGRALKLLSRCEDLSTSQLPEARCDASIVSPVAGEVSTELLKAVADKSDFTFLDPQGFLRRFGPEGRISFGSLADPGILKLVDAMKMDKDEASAITGQSGPKEALAKLGSMGVRKAVVTQGADPCYVLEGTRVYSVPVPKVQVLDSTGAGDVLGGTVVASYLRTRDFLWSACFGIAASSLSLHMIALAKLDLPMSVDDQARRLYAQASPVGNV
ncbi:MAG TPA: PfkB family carbohydrate kinase [Nitrososphaerales archaeon]|nr:PfkB family carbohydrate kinase [Nitrososphaerales archaeon]